MKKRKGIERKTYVGNLILTYESMNERIDSKPSLMIVATIAIGLTYIWAFAINIVGHVWTKEMEIMGYLLLLPTVSSLIYFISAKLKRSKKIFPITLCINFTCFLLYFNLADIMWAYAYACDGEWGHIIAVVIFKVIILIWIVISAIKLRKKLKENVDNPFEISLWVIFVLLGAVAPISSYARRRAHRKMTNLSIGYMGFLIMIVTMVMTHYWLCAFVYCKIALFGIKEKKVEKTELQ